MAFLTGGAAALAIWLYLLIARGGFWRFREEPIPGGTAPRASVVAVIPARDEAAVIGAAVRSLAGQRYDGALQVIVVDDSSCDGTAEAALGAAPGGAIRVIQGEPLPAGWTGKLWAVSQGVREASSSEPEYLLLTDADIEHPSDGVAGLVARAQAGGYDMASYMATLECRSWAERFVIPAFVFFFFMLYPPAWVADRRRRTAGGAGGCVLIRREALERIGGIEAIRGALIDDCTLAAAVKRSGGKVWLGLSRGTRSLRGYGTFAEAGRMISRSAFTQLGYSALLLAGTVAGLALTYLLPPALLLGGESGIARALGGVTWLLMAAAYAPALRYYRRSLLWAPALPLVALFYMGATAHSAAMYWAGKGGMWKGRVQAIR
jgi:hopene-associated glycosyltransferase HpnB